jgi:hypothetical protein
VGVYRLVPIAGELLKLVRDLRRAISNPVQNAAGVVKELESILAVVPSADESDADTPTAAAAAARQAASRQGSSVDTARQAGFAGLAAGFGQMRDALGGLGGASRAWAGRSSDSSSAAPAAAGPADGAVAAAGVAAPARTGSGAEK